MMYGGTLCVLVFLRADVGIAPLLTAQSQLQKIALLVGIDQYDSARMQLREGAASGLRRDLKEASVDFGATVDKKVWRAVHMRVHMPHALNCPCVDS